MARQPSRRTRSSTFSSDSRTKSGRAFYADILGIAGSLLRSRQEAGAEKIGDLAGAARNLAADLTDIPNIQSYVDAAAEQMENLSEYASQTSMEDMLDDATEIARRHPIATATFAVAAGFGFIRMITHTSDSHKEPKNRSQARAKPSSGQKVAPAKKRKATKAKPNGRYSSDARANAA